MTTPPTATFTVDATLAGKTLAATLRAHLPDHSWNQVHRLVEKRRIRVAGELWTDPARRMKEGDTIEVLPQSLSAPRQPEQVKIRFLDAHVIVVEKPTGISTVRHPSELQWSAQRKALAPTLQDIVPRLIAARNADASGKKSKGPLPRLRIVHRIDKETSGLVAFARTVAAEADLGRQFRKHTVIRRYLAIVPGRVQSATMTSRLVRDRGDGRRGSTTNTTLGKEATTHVEVVERLPAHTVLSCRLETGRTHQIRIHLAEIGHPICGEKVYNRPPSQEPIIDTSGAPRLALHAAELGFQHPVTGQDMHWTMPLPGDLESFIERLRRFGKPG
jgi:23S rRNA pseudouridine1911/1915/1917 synthase